jgi:hypothetical protein
MRALLALQLPIWRAPKPSMFAARLGDRCGGAVFAECARCGKPRAFTAAKAMIDDAAVELEGVAAIAATAKFPILGRVLHAS